MPLPESAPTFWLLPFRSSVLITVTSDLLDRLIAAPAWSVPVITIVEPLYVLAPLSVCVPVPILVSATWPAPSWITPLKFPALFVAPTTRRRGRR